MLSLKEVVIMNHNYGFLMFSVLQCAFILAGFLCGLVIEDNLFLGTPLSAVVVTGILLFMLTLMFFSSRYLKGHELNWMHVAMRIVLSQSLAMLCICVSGALEAELVTGNSVLAVILIIPVAILCSVASYTLWVYADDFVQTYKIETTRHIVFIGSTLALAGVVQCTHFNSLTLVSVVIFSFVSIIKDVYEKYTRTTRALARS